MNSVFIVQEVQGILKGVQEYYYIDIQYIITIYYTILELLNYLTTQNIFSYYFDYKGGAGDLKKFQDILKRFKRETAGQKRPKTKKRLLTADAFEYVTGSG